MSAPASRSAPAFSGHMPALDGLRGVAILLVMFLHYTVIVPQGRWEGWLFDLSGLGKHGVDLFFVLSGFLITGILLDSKGQPAASYFRNFYMRRTLRIFPLYYALVALTFLLLPLLLRTVASYAPAAQAKLARFHEVNDDWPWYVAYCGNFLLVKTQEFRHAVLDVTWSLAIEEQFYLLWAPVVFLVSPARLRWVCAAAIVFALGLRAALLFAGLAWVQIYALTPCRMDALLIGGLLAITVRQPGYRPEALCRAARGAFAVSGLGLVAFFLLGLTRIESGLMLTLGFSLVAVLCAAGIVLVLHADSGSLLGRVFTSRTLSFFGKYSYAIYLFHVPIRAALRDLAFGDAQFRRLPGSALLWQGGFYVLSTLLVIPPALLSWRLLEAPLLRLKAYFPRGRDLAPPAGRG